MVKNHNKYFVDTSALLSTLYKKDARHQQAKAISKELEKDRRKIPVITDYILDEALTLLKDRVGHKEAVKFGNLVFSGKTKLKLIYLSSKVIQEAWKLFARYSDKGFSFTYGMFINPAAFVRIHYSGSNTLDTPNNIIKANEWTHVVGTYDGKKVEIYLNGEVEAEKDASIPIPANSSSFVIGGTQESRDWFTGMIDEVKLYNRGLTEAEVKNALKGPGTPVAPTGKLTTTWSSIKSKL